MVGDQRFILLPVLSRSVSGATFHHLPASRVFGIKVALVGLTLEDFPRPRYLDALQERFLVLGFPHVLFSLTVLFYHG